MDARRARERLRREPRLTQRGGDPTVRAGDHGRPALPPARVETNARGDSRDPRDARIARAPVGQ
jgi:hypothetical protein